MLLLTFCPLCPSHISPSDRALICSTFSQQSRLPTMTKKIRKFSRQNLSRPEGSLCKRLCANFSRVSSDWLGMARVPPPPSSAYWPPHSHVRFFSDNTSEPVLVSGSSPHPPCFLTGFRKRRRRRAGGDCHTHTHTHMGHSLLHLALIGTGLLYLPRNRLFLAQKIILPLEEKKEISLWQAGLTVCGA